MVAQSRFQRLWLALVLGSVATILAAAPVAADGSSTVVKGAFHPFAAGVTQGLKISGDAVLIRTPAGRTVAVVFAYGLAANTTYGSHVHKQKCADGDADGHFQFTPGAPADGVNEIWPGFTTNPWGVGVGIAQNVGIADATAVSVVIHAPGGAKIACADLR
jgi:hypothetical protein